ncbi:hypothetical protein NBRC116583_21560 [Arenicella sp. 4NH20-0111]
MIGSKSCNTAVFNEELAYEFLFIIGSPQPRQAYIMFRLMRKSKLKLSELKPLFCDCSLF